jgi:hypothetical protein
MATICLAPRHVDAGTESATDAPPPLFVLFCLSEQPEMEGSIFVPLEIAVTPAISQELNLSETQIAKIKELVEKTKAVFSVEYPATHFRGVSYEMIERESGEARKRMMDILRAPQQAEQFKNLIFKRYGIISVQSRDLRQMLGLTPDQEYQIDMARSELFVEINKSLEQPLTRDGEQLCQIATIDSAALKALVAATAQRIEAQLTPAQLETINRIRQ